MIVTFNMPYPPSVNHYYVRTKKGMAIGKRGKLYRRYVILKLSHLKESFTKDQRLSIVINVYPPDKRKRDLDNLTKCSLDSLQHAKVFVDDGQLDSITVIRREPVEHGKLSVWITECS